MWQWGHSGGEPFTSLRPGVVGKGPGKHKTQRPKSPLPRLNLTSKKKKNPNTSHLLFPTASSSLPSRLHTLPAWGLPAGVMPLPAGVMPLQTQNLHASCPESQYLMLDAKALCLLEQPWDPFTQGLVCECLGAKLTNKLPQVFLCAQGSPGDSLLEGTSFSWL